MDPSPKLTTHLSLGFILGLAPALLPLLCCGATLSFWAFVVVLPVLPSTAVSSGVPVSVCLSPQLSRSSLRAGLV